MTTEILTERAAPKSTAIQIHSDVAADDAKLVEAAKQGDLTAFDEIATRYKRRMLRCAENVTRNHEDAEEVVQESLIRAFSNIDTFRGESRLYTWLSRITVNQALMRLRGRRTNVLSIDRSDEHDTALPRQIESRTSNPEQSYASQELREVLATEIKKLKPAVRVIVQLQYIEEFSVEETAMAVGMSIGAVKSASHRARMSLRHGLSAHFPEWTSVAKLQTGRSHSFSGLLEKRSA